MALMEVNFFSKTLNIATSCYVILPQQAQGIGKEGSEAKEKYPVLYLLHGASDDHTIWLRRTSIERYVSTMGLAVVMPDGKLSNYENMEKGGRFRDFIVDELPSVMESMFPISDRPEDRHLAGLSMGGFGALKNGLLFPEKYATIGILSSGNFFYGETAKENFLSRRAGGRIPMSVAIYGNNDWGSMQGTDRDPFVIGEKDLAEGKKMPRFFHVCGTEDGLLGSARSTRDWFLNHPAISYEYHEGPGSHNWAFWDQWIQEYLKFI